MKNLLKLSLVALSLAATGTAAHAEDTCQGKAQINSVYKTGLGGSNYEYYIQVQNLTSKTMTVGLILQNFPKDTGLFSSTLAGVKLTAHESKTIKIGRGTNATIDNNKIHKGVDHVMSEGINVAVTGCKA